jgi:uncharacterized membrane protein
MTPATGPAGGDPGGRDGRRGPDRVGLDRVNAFSDGVYAIAITLLVLELSVPERPADLASALADQWQEFLGYLISFAFIGASWLTHARMTHLMKSADGTVGGLNLLVLLFVAILPFTTNLMVVNLSGPAVAGAVVIYGFNLLVASFALSALLLYIAGEEALLVDDLADDVLAAMARARWIAIGVNVMALVIAVAAPMAAVALYLVVTLLVLLLPLVGLRRQRGRAREGRRGN